MLNYIYGVSAQPISIFQGFRYGSKAQLGIFLPFNFNLLEIVSFELYSTVKFLRRELFTKIIIPPAAGSGVCPWCLTQWFQYFPPTWELGLLP